MAVLDSNQTVSNNVSGFNKGIHATARTMMLDNLQGTMYQKPIDSAVRECVSNAIDAVREKLTAKKIKTGEAQASDFYLSREDVKDKVASEEDDIYADSEFNPDYYDLKWLNDDDSIILTYENSELTKRDKFIIHDNGVGLGGKRLEGFFSLGYSSKRLNTGELGGFGLGAKSPLATGIESYRMISRYNGKEFCFDIYSHKVDCVYGKWGDDGEINKYVEFTDTLVPEKVKVQVEQPDGTTIEEVQIKQVPYKAYYKETKEKNSTTLIMEVRKHNRQKFFDAVKSQLMYVKADVRFEEKHLNGSVTNIPFKANPIYEDDEIILSDYGYYNRPHFVIKDIAYGMIDFNEADLSQKHGNIGIKFNMEMLDVVPSRESVRYTKKTVEAIEGTYKKVAKTVENKIQDELNQTDFLEWVKACNKIMYSQGTNTSDVIGRLSQLADSSELKPMFDKSEISYSSAPKTLLTPIVKLNHVQKESFYSNKDRKWKQKTKTTEADNTNAFDRALYFQFEPYNQRKTSYLANVPHNGTGFCTFTISNTFIYLEPLFNDFVHDKTSYDETLKLIKAEIASTETDPKKLATITTNAEKALSMVSLIKNSKKSPTLYSSVVVPEGYKMNQTEGDEEEEEVDTTDLSEQQRIDQYKETLKRRRETKSFIGYKIANKKLSSYYYALGLSREEITLQDIDFDKTKLYYATDSDLSAIDILGNIAKRKGGNYDSDAATYYWDDDVKICKVAKGNLRYVKSDGESIRSYIMNDDDATLNVLPEFKKLYTAHTIRKIIYEKCGFLRNFANVNTPIYKEWKELYDYVIEAPNADIVKEDDNAYIKYLNSMYKANLTMVKHESITEDEKQELIDLASEVLKELPAEEQEHFDLDILDIDLIDKDIYERSLRLENFADVYGALFSNVEALKASRGPVNSELATELKFFLDVKKDQLEYEFEGINK